MEIDALRSLFHWHKFVACLSSLADQRVLPLDGKPGKQHQIRQAQAAQTPKSWISFVSRFRTQKRPKSYLQNLQGSKSVGSRAWELCSLHRIAALAAGQNLSAYEFTEFATWQTWRTWRISFKSFRFQASILSLNLESVVN